MRSETIITEKLTFGGTCLAKIDGKNTFVPLALPGETLEVAIEQESRTWSTARIVRIVTPSPHRREPVCPLYADCGGCNLQHADDGYQRELRLQLLEQGFARQGVQIPQVEVVHKSPLGYRARFQLHDGGLMQRRSNTIVDLPSCPCATDEINRYLQTVPQKDRPKGRCHVFGAPTMLNPGGQAPEAPRVVIAAEPHRAEPEAQKKRGKRPAQQRRWSGSTPAPQSTCTLSLCQKQVSFDVAGFFQSNVGMLEQAIPLVTGGLEGHAALDLYAGCGTFSVFLADRFDSVVLVEHNRDALVFAEQNLAGRPHQSFGVPAELWARQHAGAYVEQHGPFDAVVIDPPRSGMEPAVLDWLCEARIPQVRSLSCDAATHAHDIARLTRAGYTVQRLFLLDFYPQTSHIESLAWLTLGD